MTHRIIKTEQDRDEWFPAPGMGGIYEITCDGRVRSIDRYVNSPITGGKRLVRGRTVKLQSVKGYPAFQVPRTGGGKSTVYVHRLVALAFVPNPNGRPHVNHIDGNKSNNTPSNLEWVNHAENMRHAYDTGLTPRQKLRPGEDSIAAKLTSADVRKIRAMLASKTTQQAIADQFGVSKGAIGAIARGETWSTLDA